MATSPNRDAFIALRRFGLGARPGEAAYLKADPRGAVLATLDPAAAPLIGDLAATPAINRDIWDLHEAEKRARAAAPAAMTAQPAAPPPPRLPARLYQAEIVARLDRQIGSDAPLVERLVNFWSNHFCVSAAKGDFLRGTAGAYEREAIRPHVLGRFVDMLKASAHHPAMLQYLDNQLSVGPNSKAGLKEKKGLNENLAREIMELHTLGVVAGYTQADVTEFARILTGWTLAYRNDREAEPGTAKFVPNRHEPGAFTVMGRRYAEAGAEQLDAALDAFAAHPATARHVARKLARHFAGDAAPDALIDRLARAFQDTGGDLAAVTTALVKSDEAWTPPQAKVLPPWDLLVATGRTLGINWTYPEAARMLNTFGQPTWEVPFPAGWPDDDDAWAAPDSLLEMLDAALALARRNIGDRDPGRLAEAVLGPLLGEPSRQAIRRAGSREEALALLVMSPEFLRR